MKIAPICNKFSASKEEIKKDDKREIKVKKKEGK